jgi:Spy/CpxP family protein refolding chaperone
MRAASLNQIYQTLTPEQRKKADELKNRFDRQTPRRPMPAPGDERPGRVVPDAGST